MPQLPSTAPQMRGPTLPKHLQDRLLVRLRTRTRTNRERTCLQVAVVPVVPVASLGFFPSEYGNVPARLSLRYYDKYIAHVEYLTALTKSSVVVGWHASPAPKRCLKGTAEYGDLIRRYTYRTSRYP